MLSNDELAQIKKLSKKLKGLAVKNAFRERLYYMKDKVKDLGVNTPEEFQDLNIQLGWCSDAVNVPLERIQFTGYYSPVNGEDTEWLNKIYRDNFFESNQKGHQRDSMITGTSFISIGLGDTEKGEPEVLWRSENSKVMTAEFDHRTQKIEVAYKEITTAKQVLGVLFTKEWIIEISRPKYSSKWVEDSRTPNEIGVVPVVVVRNSADDIYPFGISEITPSIQSHQDSAKRALLDVEVTREFYTLPLRTMLGVDPSVIQDIKFNGGKISITTTAGEVIMVPGFPDQNGQWQTPTMTELTGGSPTEVMSLIEPYARLAARDIGVPPSHFGFETANQASADAINASDAKLLKKVNAKLPVLRHVYREMAMISALLVDREISEDLKEAEAVFARTDTTTPSAAADRLSKLVAVGINEKVLPDWQYRELGLSETEIKQQKVYVQQQQAANMIFQLAAGATVPAAEVTSG